MRQRRGIKALVAAITLAVGAATTGVGAASSPHSSLVLAKGTRWERVIVSATSGHLREAALAVQALHGQVGAVIPLIDGFSAKVPAGSEAALRASSSVRSVSPDAAIHFDTQSLDPGTTSTNAVRSTKAGTLWNAGGLGQGIGVAVVDTGISPSDDVNGRVVYGPDLSGEGTLVDTFGHGTVMGGIIGGNGAQSSASHPYTGIAPQSTLVAVKTAGANGATDVTTILQALNWVSAYATQFNIRVLNLSWGLGSTQSYLLDPVDYAVERLWNQGIVVVVSAGNAGPSSGTITTPGSDPEVITVGAYDDKQNSSTSDDVVSQWSSEGPTQSLVAKPDIVAPGRTIIATRSHGSTIEQENPQALISNDYIKGSGTSQAAAVTSGVVADMLSLRPSLTPDQVKNMLKNNANPIPGTSANAQGAGRLTIPSLFQLLPAGLAHTQVSLATGLGSVEASRGGVDYATNLVGGVLSPITGEIDTKGEAWNPVQWTGSQWTGSQWTGSQWTGSQWTGSQWTGSQWTNASWTGSQWTGGQWTGGSWQGSAWTGSQWTGSQWTSSAWTGSQWTGSQWTGSQWTGGTWDGSQWTGSQWTGSQWTGSQWTGSQWTDGAWEDAFWGDAPPNYAPLPGEPVLDAATSALEMAAHVQVDINLGLI